MHKEFAFFAEALEEVGRRIDQAQESYHTARKRLADGRGNLLRQIEMLRELGAENSKDLPEEMEKDLVQADLLKDGDDGAIASSEQPGGNHSAGNHSAGNHSAGNHSAGDHSAGEHSAGDHSAGDHSAGHQPDSDSPEKENSPE